MSSIGEQIAAAAATDTLLHAAQPADLTLLPWANTAGGWSETTGWNPPSWALSPPTNDHGGLYYNVAALSGGNAFTVLHRNNAFTHSAERQFSVYLFTDPYKATVLADEPIGYWRLDESAGPTAADTSGHTNNGTYNGTPTFSVAGAIVNDFDTAVTLGNLNYVKVPDSASLRFADKFTLEAWVNRASLTNDVIIDSNFSGGVTLRFTADGKRVRIRKSFVADIAESTVEIGTGAWHHIVVTKEGASVHIYVDGKDVTGTVTNQTISESNVGFYLGAGEGGINFFLNGSLDEVAMYNHALSPQRVLAHYNAGLGINGYQCTAFQASGTADTYTFKLVKYVNGVASVLDEVTGVTMKSTGAFAVAANNGKVSMWVQAEAGKEFTLVGEEVSDTTFREGWSAFAGNGSNPKLANFGTGVLVEAGETKTRHPHLPPPPAQLVLMAIAEGGEGRAYDLTDEADGLSFSNVNPGGDEVCTFTIHRSWYAENPEIAKGNIIQVISGIDVLWRGRVEEVDRGTGDAESLVVTAYGLGNRLKDDTFRQIFIDRDLSAWGPIPNPRVIELGTSYTTTAGTAEVRPGEDGLNALVLSFSHVNNSNPPNDLVEVWYDAKGIPIDSIYYNTSNFDRGAGGENKMAAPWNAKVVAVTGQTFSTGFDASANILAGPYANTLSTTAPRYFACVQFWFAGVLNSDGDWQFRCLNLHVLGEHGLAPQGEQPNEGFTVDQMVAYIIGLASNVTARRIDTQAFIVQQATYFEAISHADGIADLNRYSGCDYGTWGPDSAFDRSNAAYFDFKNRDSATQHWFAMRADFADDLAFHTEISTLYDAVDVHWQNEAGQEFTERFTIFSPDLAAAGLSPRVFALEAGLTTKANAQLLAEVFLNVFAGFAPARGSGSLVGTVRHYRRGEIPAYYMRADGSNLRIPDILPAETAFALDATPDRRTTFPLKRVTVDCSGDAPKTTVEFDQTSDALSVLLAQQALQGSLIG